MSLSLDLAAILQPLIGQSFVPPQAVSVQDGAGTTITLRVVAVERMGVSCEELQLIVPHLRQTSLDLLKTWAEALCRRVTYLLENLGPLEYDATAQEVLIRSTTPDSTQPQSPKYYEVILSAQGQGQFTLRRYEADRVQGGRVPVPLHLTHEQLAKLVNDLVGTIPTAP